MRMSLRGNSSSFGEEDNKITTRGVKKGERKREGEVYLKQRISKRCHTRSRGCSCDKGSTDTWNDVVGEARHAGDTRLDSLTT